MLESLRHLKLGNEPAKRVGVAIALLVLAALLHFALPRVDARATASLDVNLKRALATFAIARTINGVLSAVQETTVGVGITVAPGQVLDPLNDVIEQFSTVMLVASASLAAQRLLVGVGSHEAVAIALVVSTVALAVVLLAGRRSRLLVGLFATLLLVRALVPVVVVATDFVFEHTVRGKYEQAHGLLTEVSSSTEREGAAATVPPAEIGWLERSTQWLSATKQALQTPGALRKHADRIVDQTVALIAVFVLQTIVLPLIWLAVVVWGVRRLAAGLAAPAR